MSKNSCNGRRAAHMLPLAAGRERRFRGLARWAICVWVEVDEGATVQPRWPGDLMRPAAGGWPDAARACQGQVEGALKEPLRVTLVDNRNVAS